MRRIAMSGKKGKGKYVLIDDDIFSTASKYRWYLSRDGYAVSNSTNHDVTRKTIWIQTLVLKIKKGMRRDHINGNKLDNRRKNLRYCTPAQNIVNSKIQKSNNSGYKGVCWYKPKNEKIGYWYVQLSLNNKRIYLGRYKNKLEAIKIFRKEAKKHYGEYYKFK